MTGSDKVFWLAGGVRRARGPGRCMVDAEVAEVVRRRVVVVKVERGARWYGIAESVGVSASRLRGAMLRGRRMKSELAVRLLLWSL